MEEHIKLFLERLKINQPKLIMITAPTTEPKWMVDKFKEGLIIIEALKTHEPTD